MIRVTINHDAAAAIEYFEQAHLKEDYFFGSNQSNSQGKADPVAVKEPVDKETFASLVKTIRP